MLVCIEVVCARARTCVWESGPVYIFVRDIPQRADDCWASTQQILHAALITLAVAVAHTVGHSRAGRRACRTGPLGSYATARSRAASRACTRPRWLRTCMRPDESKACHGTRRCSVLASELKRLKAKPIGVTHPQCAA
jgi:hypothetical protein